MKVIVSSLDKAGKALKAREQRSHPERRVAAQFSRVSYFIAEVISKRMWKKETVSDADLDRALEFLRITAVACPRPNAAPSKQSAADKRRAMFAGIGRNFNPAIEPPPADPLEAARRLLERRAQDAMPPNGTAA